MRSPFGLLWAAHLAFHEKPICRQWEALAFYEKLFWSSMKRSIGLSIRSPSGLLLDSIWSSIIKPIWPSTRSPSGFLYEAHLAFYEKPIWISIWSTSGLLWEAHLTFYDKLIGPSIRSPFDLLWEAHLAFYEKKERDRKRERESKGKSKERKGMRKNYVIFYEKTIWSSSDLFRKKKHSMRKPYALWWGDL